VFAPGAARWIVPVAAAGIVVAALTTVRVLPAVPVGVGGAVGLLAVAAFFAVFFRDPVRPVGRGIVSPADGRVRDVGVEGDRLRISVFMNVTNVHVNRAPIDATVESVHAEGRGYRAAYRSDSEHNVRRVYRLSTAVGPVELVQIAGAVARRVVPFVHDGATVRKGDRIGMIVLGSRVDLVLPAARVRPVVAVGDRVVAGVTTVAEEAS